MRDASVGGDHTSRQIEGHDATDGRACTRHGHDKDAATADAAGQSDPLPRSGALRFARAGRFRAIAGVGEAASANSQPMKTLWQERTMGCMPELQPWRRVPRRSPCTKGVRLWADLASRLRPQLQRRDAALHTRM
jgi:hypothetical protein